MICFKPTRPRRRRCSRRPLRWGVSPVDHSSAMLAQLCGLPSPTLRPNSCGCHCVCWVIWLFASTKITMTHTRPGECATMLQNTSQNSRVKGREQKKKPKTKTMLLQHYCNKKQMLQHYCNNYLAMQHTYCNSNILQYIAIAIYF